jgi:hypothetical protein
LLKRSWHKWVLLCVLLAGSLFLLEKIFDLGIKHNLNLKSAYVSLHKIDADILILGPCEPLWMVSPEMTTKRTGLSCYNLASSHSDFADNYLHLLLYLKNNKKPRSLLLFVTPESFDTNYNTFHTYRFASFLNYPEVREAVEENSAAYASWTWLPFMKHAWYSHKNTFFALQGWKHYLTGREQPYYPDGFEPPARITWDNHHENLKKAYPRGYQFSWSKRREAYFMKILLLCQEQNIPLNLYESPVLKEIRDYQVNRAEFIERIRALAGKEAYTVFDSLPWAGDRKYFISPMVTTLEGSYLFSDTLGGWLKGKIVK